jgi:3-hydroxybutyryl-CoA dehydratase
VTAMRGQTRVLGAADVMAWADVVDDHNPLHLDEDYASRTRFGRPIVHGSLLFSVVSDAVQEASGWTPGQVLRMRFRSPVPVGEPVRLDQQGDTLQIRCGDVEPVEVVRDRPEEAT